MRLKLDIILATGIHASFESGIIPPQKKKKQANLINFSYLMLSNEQQVKFHANILRSAF